MPRPAVWLTQGFFSHRLRDQGKKLTTYLHLVQRLRRRELTSTPPTHLHGTHRDNFTLLWTHATSRAGMTILKNLPECESVCNILYHASFQSPLLVLLDCAHNNKFVLTFLQKVGAKLLSYAVEQPIRSSLCFITSCLLW